MDMDTESLATIRRKALTYIDFLAGQLKVLACTRSVPEALRSARHHVSCGSPVTARTPVATPGEVAAYLRRPPKTLVSGGRGKQARATSGWAATATGPEASRVSRAVLRGGGA